MLKASSGDHARRKASEQQLNRACEACRSSKVRCLASPTGASQCQRCLKTGKSCVFLAPAKRRQRKRTDVRVAELEREIKQMRSLLKPNQLQATVELSDDEGSDDTADDEQDDQSFDERQPGAPSDDTSSTPLSVKVAGYSSAQQKERPACCECCGIDDCFGSTKSDVIDRGIITKELAEELLQIYIKDSFFPAVFIPATITASQLRVTKPALFLAIMAAASCVKGTALSSRLHMEVMHLYARDLFITGMKSLEHVQALLVTVAYYSPPDSPPRLHSQIYQYSTMAVSIALELGLATKPRTQEQLPKRAIRSLQRISSPEELLENCRTILCLYVLSAGFAMRLHRPNPLLFNVWMEECLRLLQNSPVLNDKKVVALVKLQRIADEANTAFGFDDPSTSFSLSELRLQVILRVFDKRMKDWRDSTGKDVMDLFILGASYQNTMSMWEFAMDGGKYDAPDFNNRHLSLPALDGSCVQPETLLSGSALQINGTIRVISEAHAICDSFLQFPIRTVQGAPNAIFVRPVYALIALSFLTVKVDYAVGTDAKGLGEVLDSSSLKIDHYLNTTLRMVRDAIGWQECRIPQYWFFILGKLKLWHNEHQKWRKGRKQSGSKRSKTRGGLADDRDGDVEGLQTAATAAATADAITVDMPSFVATIRVSDSLCPGDTAHQQELPAPATATATARTQAHPIPNPLVPQPSEAATRYAKRDVFMPWPAGCELAVETPLQGSQLQPQPPTAMEGHIRSYTQTQAQTQPSQSAPAFDLSNVGLGEFETALQHGDLYLWTEEMASVGFSNWMEVDGVGDGGVGNAVFGDGDGNGHGHGNGHGNGAADLGGWNGFGGAGAL